MYQCTLMHKKRQTFRRCWSLLLFSDFFLYFGQGICKNQKFLKKLTFIIKNMFWIFLHVLHIERKIVLKELSIHVFSLILVGLVGKGELMSLQTGLNRWLIINIKKKNWHKIAFKEAVFTLAKKKCLRIWYFL